MRLRAFALAALFAATAQAQVVWVRTTMAGKPTCEAGIKGRVFEISDATTESDCSIGGATGNARKMSLCWCVWTAGTSAYEWQAIARGTAGATSPGGSDTQVQYNDGSAFGGDAGMTFNETTNVLTVTGGVNGNSSTATALAANGANCSAGSYPLGVDASGAAESCTVAPGGASSGAPPTSGTLALWLAADDSSLADSSINGKGVWLWHDRSGNGRDAYQLDASLRPTVTLSSQNSLSGFTTPAGGNLLGGNGPGTVSAGSVYVVIKPGTVGANNRIFSLSSYASPTSDYNGGIAALLVDGGAATTMRAFRTSLGNDLDIAGGTLGTSAALFVLRWGAGSAALRKNNDSETTDTYTDYSFRADLFSILAGPTGLDAMSGAAVIYEILWYSTKLSDGDDTTVRAYINSKWALW